MNRLATLCLYTSLGLIFNSATTQVADQTGISDEVYPSYSLASIDRVMPRIGGSATFYQFTERLGLPMVFIGLGNGTGA